MKTLIISMPLLIIGCSHFEGDLSSAKGSFEYANYLLKKKQYDLAIETLQDVRKFSNSEYITKAELQIPDVYFKLRRYEEALYFYNRFKELYPKHKSSARVIWQIALCHYNRLPRTSDRDLSLAHDTLKTIAELITKYPKFENLEKAKSIKLKLINMLVQKELGIANYYLKSGHYKSALNRYLTILDQQNKTVAAASLLGAGIAQLKLNNKEEGKKYLNTLITQFESSKHAKKATKIMKEYGI